jgi:tetratricopeptide (TPR) repeat protein
MDRIVQLKDFIEKYPGDMFSRHALAMEYLKVGNESQAEEVMRLLLRDDPNHTGTYYHLGKLLEKMGRTDEAIAVYEEGIQICQRLTANTDLRELKGALILIKEDDL